MGKFLDIYQSDAHRYGDSSSFMKRAILYFKYPGVKYSFWMRLSCALKRHKLAMPLYLIARMILRHCSYRFGIDIPYNTEIGGGFYIGHFGAIVVNGMAKIGQNVNISQGVTIGQSNRGDRRGVPTIGSRVYIGPGAKIIGNIQIGNNVAIGANAVVTKDVPDNAVVAGIPARIISMDGADGYVDRVV